MGNYALDGTGLGEETAGARQLGGATLTSPGLRQPGARHQSQSQAGLSSTVLEHYQVGKIIGQGAYAVVKLCQHKQTHKKYAVKIYEKSKLTD